MHDFFDKKDSFVIKPQL